MFKSYLKTTIRNLLKNKIFSFVNISGLAIGVACFILIGLFVVDEISYDSFNVNADRIFRVNAHYNVGGNRFNLANSPLPLAGVLASEYPEIEKTVRILQGDNIYIKKDNDYIKEEKFIYADSSIFDIFTIDFVRGNPKSALSQPNNIVLTTKASEKYFGNGNPVGERIILSNGQEYSVTGVVKPLPGNSHFEFDFVASYSTLPESRLTNWFGNFVHTYVLTRKGVLAKQLNDKIFSVTEKHLGPIVKESFGVSYRDFLREGNDISFVFVPIKQIHLYSNVFNEFKQTGDINMVYLFSAIAIFILIIACINFINLSTAKSTKRAGEIGIRKVLGSNKLQLIKQFLIESTLLCFIAVLLAIMIVELVLPSFNELTGKNLSLNLSSIGTIPELIIFTVLLGIAAGFYPSILLASFKPVEILKSKSLVNNYKSAWLKKGLVVFQFAISIILFISTFVIYNQMQYIKNKNLGFNKDQIIVIKNVNNLGAQEFTYANSIRENPNIINASLSSGLPDHDLSANILRKEGTNEDQTLVVIPVDYNFLATYGIKMKEGRFFNRENSTDSSTIILNEAAVKKLEYSNPLNSKLMYRLGGNRTEFLTVIGVVKDFHLQSLKDAIRPAALILLNTPEANYLSVKISPYKISEAIKYLSKKWKEFGQIKPLEYTFFDEYFAETYKSQIQSEKVFTIFAVLAVFIACLGLFGLAAFTAEQKTKEIGVRKVLGATITNIITMLSKEFIILVLIANLIAWPVAYFIMKKWLEDFAYRTDLSIYLFILAGLIVFVIALLIVSYQALKAAVANPVKSLRYE